jgi:hypothetical protein
LVAERGRLVDARRQVVAVLRERLHVDHDAAFAVRHLELVSRTPRAFS